MLPRSHTLRSGEFSQILKEGKTIRSPLFVLRIKKATVKSAKTEKTSRFSVVVSKKIAKTAVERNFTRRKVYSALETFIKDIPAGYEGVISVAIPLANTPYATVLGGLRNIFSQASLI